jgi:hypothetical protein
VKEASPPPAGRKPRKRTSRAAAGGLIQDADSGLFSEAFLWANLPLRVATGRRALRQFGFVLLEIEPDGMAPAELGSIVRSTLRDSDMACLLDDGHVALMLELTPLKGSIRAAARVRDVLDRHHPTARVWAGVATYPVHAIDETQLVAAAQVALRTARGAAAGTIGVAPRPS